MRIPLPIGLPAFRTVPSSRTPPVAPPFVSGLTPDSYFTIKLLIKNSVGIPITSADDSPDSIPLVR